MTYMQEGNVELSIIIPAYNCEDYLQSCVESIVQDSPNCLEVLIVDDGSTDSTPEICNNLRKMFSNVYVFHKKNEGQGIARNYALKYARGTYVAFVDADDLPTIGAYREAIKVMLSGDYDLGVFKWDFIDHDYCEKIYIQPESGNVISIPRYDEVLVDISNYHTKYGSGVWNKIYRKSVILENNICFHSERSVISEDYLFNFDYLPYCQKIAASSLHLYNHRQNPMSYCHRYQEGYYGRLENFVRYIEANNSYSTDVLSKTVFKKYSFVKTCIIQEVKHKTRKVAQQEIRHICDAITTGKIIGELDKVNLDFINRAIAYMIKYKLTFLLYILYKAKQ